MQVHSDEPTKRTNPYGEKLNFNRNPGSARELGLKRPTRTGFGPRLLLTRQAWTSKPGGLTPPLRRLATIFFRTSDRSVCMPPMSRPPPKRENLLLTLACNILIPSLILTKLSTPERLGPEKGLIVALAFPLVYGVWDFARRRQTNFVSVIGFISVLLTGGLGLMQVDGLWFAVKEAAVPAVIGFAVWASMYSRRPLVRQFLFNEQVIDVPRVEAALDARGNRARFEVLLANASYWLVASFLVSAALNFALARWLLRSPAGSPEFNAELGRMNLLSWPVIVVPTMAMSLFALWRLLSGITHLSGLKFEDVFHADAKKS